MTLEFLKAFDFFTGVPDSQLRALCDYLIATYGTDPQHHIIAANEGNAVAIAAGYHLATGKTPVVYLQNSGEGNIINPIASLINEKVYGIPCFFVIGWRGEPDVHDEPQHIYQGEVTLKLLEDMDISYSVIKKDTTEKDIFNAMSYFEKLFAVGKQAAFVVRKGALEYHAKIQYGNSYTLTREEVIRHIVAHSGTDPIISTTGKASRELFEIREQNGQGHAYDFLTVGSMGHSSSIALGIALQKPEKQIWVIDGDGAAIMHMGSLAVIGSIAPNNLIHIVLNNAAHESVGGMPTAADRLDVVQIARGCGYRAVESVETIEQLDEALARMRERCCLQFLEVKCALGSRTSLGRPTCLPRENKQTFMDHMSAF